MSQTSVEWDGVTMQQVHCVDAIVGSDRYTIPQSWLMGFVAGRPGATTEDAVRHWHEQAQMERENDRIKEL